MKTFKVYQTVYLGTIDVPGALSNVVGTDEIIEYMDSNDCWPQDAEVVDTTIVEVTE